MSDRQYQKECKLKIAGLADFVLKKDRGVLLTALLINFLWQGKSNPLLDRLLHEKVKPVAVTKLTLNAFVFWDTRLDYFFSPLPKNINDYASMSFVNFLNVPSYNKKIQKLDTVFLKASEDGVHPTLQAMINSLLGATNKAPVFKTKEAPSVSSEPDEGDEHLDKEEKPLYRTRKTFIETLEILHGRSKIHKALPSKTESQAKHQRKM